jgi:hypothetical protein
MKTGTLTVVLSTMVLSALGVACADAPASDDGDSNAAASTGNGPTVTVGDYVVQENESFGATLTVTSVTPTSFTYSYGILGKTGSQHNGELNGRTARLASGMFIDTIDSDCKMTFRLVYTDISVTQTGSCSDAGFGAFLDGSGVYKKKAAAASKWVGLYETETTHRAWAIRVNSEAPFTFQIVAGHYEDSSEFVDAKGLIGTLAGDKVTYENGPDCALTLTKEGTALHVVQSGTCKVLGFPANDDLSMGDESGFDFNVIDESKECFDKSALAVSIDKSHCKSPL